MSEEQQQTRFVVLVVPDSIDETAYETADDLEAARAIAAGRHDSAVEHRFDSARELNAFLVGYGAGVGFLGSGVWFTAREHLPAPEAVRWPDDNSYPGEGTDYDENE